MKMINVITGVTVKQVPESGLRFASVKQPSIANWVNERPTGSMCEPEIEQHELKPIAFYWAKVKHPNFPVDPETDFKVETRMQGDFAEFTTYISMTPEVERTLGFSLDKIAGAMRDQHRHIERLEGDKRRQFEEIQNLRIASELNAKTAKTADELNIHYMSMIECVATASLWRRLKYLFTGVFNFKIVTTDKGVQNDQV